MNREKIDKYVHKDNDLSNMFDIDFIQEIMNYTMTAWTINISKAHDCNI